MQQKKILTLRPYDFGERVAKTLADALKAGQYTQVIADALKTGQYTQGLMAKLDSRIISNEGAKDIADALKSGRCPQGLNVSLRDNEISNAGAKALADALKSGECPQDLAIDLTDNRIQDEGALELAGALRSDECPQGLQIGLSENRIGEVGAKELAAAMKSNTAVVRLEMGFPNVIVSNFSREHLNIIKHCCLRNRLLKQYPEFETLIKEISYKAGMYAAKPIALPSLKNTAGLFLSSHREINREFLPKELKEYLVIFDEVERLKPRLKA